MVSNVSLVNLFILAVTVISACESGPAPYIIGGGLNTDFDITDSNPAIYHHIKSAFPKLHRSNVQANTQEVTENHSVERNNELLGINLSPPVISGMNRINPFLRAKREACQTLAILPKKVSRLYTILNSTQFLGRYPQQSSRVNVPTAQPQECPQGSNSWWSVRTETNLRSTCPWRIVERDLGEDAFPRYIPEAACLCDRCINSPTMGCVDLRHNVTYYQRQSVQDRLALMSKKTIEITVGCYCASAERQPANSAPPLDY